MSSLLIIYNATRYKAARCGSFDPNNAQLASTTAVNVINTVEKMQGQERDLVIVCYAGFDFNEPSELDFAYQRERLNTGVSRAKKKCILLVDPKVLNPAIAVCETAERQAGYELLLAHQAIVRGGSSASY